MKKKKQSLPRFYYRVNGGSATGQRMTKLNLHRVEVMQQAADLAQELGAIDFSQSPAGIMGGIGSLFFSHPQSTREYRKIGKCGKLMEYIPNPQRQKGYEVAMKINKLPLIHSDEVMTSIGIVLEKDDVFPEWFVGEGCFYFRSRKEMLHEEFVPVTEEEYETALTMIETEIK